MQNIESIINNLDNAVELDLTADEIFFFCGKLKEFEKKLKGKQKKQKISINKAIWSKAEKFTKQLNLDTTSWVEKLILQEIKNNSAIIKVDNYEDYLEAEKNYLLDKYKGKTKQLVKTDKYIQVKEAEFNGHSVIDGEPIYKVKNPDLAKKLDKVVKMKEVTIDELTRNMPGDEDKEIVLEDKTIF